jgi:hypothetical protein
VLLVQATSSAIAVSNGKQVRKALIGIRRFLIVIAANVCKIFDNLSKIGIAKVLHLAYDGKMTVFIVWICLFFHGSAPPSCSPEASCLPKKKEGRLATTNLSTLKI